MKIHPLDAFICCDSIHRDIQARARADRTKMVVAWLRERAAQYRTCATRFNKRESYAIALECAANDLERGGVWGP